MKFSFFILAGFLTLINIFMVPKKVIAFTGAKRSVDTVCPPFFLRDENGNIINPVKGINENEPYSPRNTCGAAGCHDYDLITQGYHFTQGAGEEPTEAQAKRCQWVSSPGNYGGSWCSPAPLYRYLSAKKNDSSKEMDMTSFSFITSGCGKCHPGGGSAEYDRAGFRYDEFMQNAGYTSSGDNDFDGDYYKARWRETGVLEADCMICHQPKYNYSERNKQLGMLNFRWAPTAASTWAIVSGSIQNDTPVKVEYNLSVFNADGRISPHIVREPRNEACTNCHAQPGWKKRGANFSARTDVHLRAEMKCVDCHPAGSQALDSRINGKEMHQIAKGDDPGGQVRNDLDNTMLDCDYCHTNGHLGAPIAKHTWLPPLHLESIACQTCHIPQRTVKAAQVQAGDVFNPGTKIPTKGKHLWTFYGPDIQYYNHYGNMGMMGFEDKPTDIFTPQLAKYKGKIYPVNRVHSAWPAIEVEGKPGLLQPRMGDIYKMWSSHFADQTTYPELSNIKDDNSDSILEVNRPEEIDALITSVTTLLNDIDYPMEGKRIVWAMNDRVYSSGSEYRTLPKEEWEASVYGNVHTYNHDVFPARSALGSNGCLDCHDHKSAFFMSQVVRYPFDENGNAVTMRQYRLFGLTPFSAWAGIWRETWLKSVLYIGLFLLLLIPLALAGEFVLRWTYGPHPMPKVLTYLPVLLVAVFSIAVLMMMANEQLVNFILPSRFWLDSNHFAIAMLILFAGILAIVYRLRNAMQKKSETRKQMFWTSELVITFVVLFVAGLLMMIKIPALVEVNRFAYTVFDVALLFVLFGTLVTFYARIIKNTGDLHKLKGKNRPCPVLQNDYH